MSEHGGSRYISIATDDAVQGLFNRYSESHDAADADLESNSSPGDRNTIAYGTWSTRFEEYVNVSDMRSRSAYFSGTYSPALQVRRLLGRGTLGLQAGIRPNPWKENNGMSNISGFEASARSGNLLMDRRSPNDLPLALSASYSWPVTQNSSIFGYVGLPGRPATYSYSYANPFYSIVEDRTTATDYHWLDSTEASSGIVTVGYVWRAVKLESSTFSGQEIQDRPLIKGSPRPFAVTSGKISVNPTPSWTLQLSRGQRNRPDQFDPNDEIRRTTVSAIYNRAFDRNNWQTTIAIGRGASTAGGNTSAFLFESVLKVTNAHTYFGRFERASNAELFNDIDTLHGQLFNANKVTLGYVYDFAGTGAAKLGVGALATKRFIPEEQFALYGRDPASYKVFMRLLVQIP